MIGIELACPYCGRKWMYVGLAPHYAKCRCKKWIRIHPYEIRTRKRPLTELKFPNENYVRWWENE